MRADHPPRSRLSWAAAAVLIVLILALAGGFAFYQMETLPLRTARQVQDAFAAVTHLQPRVTVNDHVTLEGPRSALELTVVTRDTAIERELDHTWMGSEKRLKLRGHYRIRAGFDLGQSFDVRVKDRNVLVELPAPRILSVDQIDCEVLAYQNGLWNKVHPEEVAAELKKMPGDAARKAESMGFPGEAFQSLEAQLKDKFSPYYRVEVKARMNLPEAPKG
jgi:hypothetical protein